MRELSVVKVAHPDHLAKGAFVLVDHPVLRPLTDGAPALGWEGDPRLAVYLHQRSKTFLLVRLEADGRYRQVCRSPQGAVLTGGHVNRLIRMLVASDSHRGFDPIADVDRAEAKADAVAEAALSDRVEGDLAPRMRHAVEDRPRLITVPSLKE